MDQHFGTGLHRDDLMSSVWGHRPAMTRTGYLRPWQRAASNLLKSEAGSTVNIDKEKFEVMLDVQQFAPNEVNVKVVDNFVVVEGKHEEKPDEHGYIQRNFMRRYRLPNDVDPENIKSQLSSDGLLTICAPLKQLKAPNEERAIPITQTGEPANKDEQNKIENKA